MNSVTKSGKSPAVMYADLEMAFFFISDACTFDAAAYICRKTGKIFWESGELGEEFETPDDLHDSKLYASVPDKFDLDLGKVLVFRFIRMNLPDHDEHVSGIFRRRGAYARFKDFLEDQGKLDDWYRFEESATETALREWAEEEGFEVIPEKTN